MFGIASDNPDVMCPSCRRVMVDLKGYDEASGGDALSMSDGFRAPSRGGRQIFLLFEVFDFLLESVLMMAKVRKIKRLCQDELPANPKTLVCPVCLFVFRRR